MEVQHSFLFLSLSLSPLRLADGIPVDGDVEEGARDLLELNSCEINGAAITLPEASATGGVAHANGNARKRSTSGKCCIARKFGSLLE